MTPAVRPNLPPRQPTPVTQLTRVQIAARLAVLRAAVDALFWQSGLDRGEAFRCVGAMRVIEQELEREIETRDAQAGRGEPLAAAVTSPAAERRLRQAGADLAEVVREIALDGARAMARVAEREHQALLHAVEVVPPDELLALAPSLARELTQPRQEA